MSLFQGMIHELVQLFSHWHRQRACHHNVWALFLDLTFLSSLMGSHWDKAALCPTVISTSSCPGFDVVPPKNLICAMSFQSPNLPNKQTRWEFPEFWGEVEWRKKKEVELGQTTTELGRPLSSSSPVPIAPNMTHTCWKGQVLIDNRAPAISLLFLSCWKSPVLCKCVCVWRKRECFFFIHRE